MMHVCIFPNLITPIIYGFDVIAGKNKMTGAFLIFPSVQILNIPTIQGYYESVEHFVPEKQRELPEWARNIFTGKMLAAGNVKTEEEADEIIRIALSNLHAYFDEVGATDGEADSISKCMSRLLLSNPTKSHIQCYEKSRSSEEDVDVFCKDMLFPKIHKY